MLLPMFLTHLVNLLVHSAAIAPSRIGSNWGGVVFALLVFAATELALWWAGEMTGRWTKNVLIGLGAVLVSWIGLFTVSIVLTSYDDHQNLAGAARRIKHDGNAQVEVVTAQLRTAKSDVEKQTGELKTECAVKDGINQTLQKQNRDEQVLIAGCQTQALRLLIPAETKVTPIVFDADNTNAAIRVIRWLLIINKQVPPHLNVACPEGVNYMQSATMRIIGGPGVVLGGGGGRLGPTAWEINEGNGTWSPENPLLLTIEYRGLEQIACSFIPR
jgi:hypothetical protein